MKPYQEEYLALLRSVSQAAAPTLEAVPPQAFVAGARAARRAARQAAERGTRLLREELFPVLDNILSAPEEELASLSEFAGQLMHGLEQTDVGLHYQIHLALMNYARHVGDRDMLIRELYLVGMSLYNLETMLSPDSLRLYSARMRMYFAEGAAYFDTDYDTITDPETRGYIYRCLGNIALGYDGRTPASARAKLAAIDRSIRLLNDPDIRAKTPSLPWDLFLYKSHQERTTLLSYLRSGEADHNAFTQVLESAQLVQQRQLKAARERGEALQPRWQYAYLAARYHCGALSLPELLDGLYALSTACGDGDYGTQGIFAHAGVPAYFMEYSRPLEGERAQQELSERIQRMTRRMFRWAVGAPSNENREQLLLALRQFLYAYRELPGCMPYFEVLQNVFAARHPTSYVRMWIAGQIVRELCGWAIDDCPDALVGLPGCARVEDVVQQRRQLLDMANQAGRLYDVGMVHFFNLESSVCRGLFEEEEALLQLHAHCGAKLLAQRPSTALFADVAHGHHRHYDEKGGIPVDFSLHDSPMRPLICLVAVADALAATTEEAASRYRPLRSFDEALAAVLAGERRQYAPFVCALLRAPGRSDQLRADLAVWNREAYLDLYRRREQMRGLSTD